MSAAGPLNDEPTAPNERKQSLLNAASKLAKRDFRF